MLCQWNPKRKRLTSARDTDLVSTQNPVLFVSLASRAEMQNKTKDNNSSVIGKMRGRMMADIDITHFYILLAFFVLVLVSVSFLQVILTFVYYNVKLFKDVMDMGT